jgi:hypothetical protein
VHYKNSEPHILTRIVHYTGLLQTTSRTRLYNGRCLLEQRRTRCYTLRRPLDCLSIKCLGIPHSPVHHLLSLGSSSCCPNTAPQNEHSATDVCALMRTGWRFCFALAVVFCKHGYCICTGSSAKEMLQENARRKQHETIPPNFAKQPQQSSITVLCRNSYVLSVPASKPQLQHIPA